MKRIIGCGALALLVVSVFATPACADYDWSGVYLGVNGGAVWNNSYLNSEPIYSDKASAIGGGMIGINYQINKFILGIEGDADVTGINVDAVCPGYPGSSCQNQQHVLGAVRGRFGVQMFDSTFVYGAGGIAFSDYKFNDNIPGSASSGSGMRTGYTLGLGVDHAITEHWFLGFEFNYYDFSNSTPSNFSETDHTLMARLGFKF